MEFFQTDSANYLLKHHLQNAGPLCQCETIFKWAGTKISNIRKYMDQMSKRLGNDLSVSYLVKMMFFLMPSKIQISNLPQRLLPIPDPFHSPGWGMPLLEYMLQ